MGWNVHVRNSPATVGAKLDAIHAQHRPVLIALQEAFRQRGNLGGRVPQHRRLWDGGHQEAKNNPILLRGKELVDLQNTWVMRMTQGWRFRKRKPPRRFRVARWALRGLSWTTTVTINVHFPTGGPNGRNAGPWREAARRVVEHAHDCPDPVVQIVGDFNGTAAEVGHWIAKPIGGRVLSAAKVDHMVVRDGKRATVRIRGEVQRLGRAASDHWALLYRLIYTRRP